MIIFATANIQENITIGKFSDVVESDRVLVSGLLVGRAGDLLGHVDLDLLFQVHQRHLKHEVSVGRDDTVAGTFFSIFLIIMIYSIKTRRQCDKQILE